MALNVFACSGRRFGNRERVSCSRLSEFEPLFTSKDFQ